MVEESSDNKVNFAPTKMFVIQTLTKDINLTEAILDLIDNSIDSYIENDASGKRDIKIIISEHEFVIEDNCGGIHVSDIYNKVFRFGAKNTHTDETLGVYGVGLKRSIFKMGSDITIESDDTKDSFVLHIDEEWLNDEDEWMVSPEIKESPNDKPFLKITVKQLYSDVVKEFGSQTFINEVRNKIEKTYSLIMDKKVDIYVNEVLSTPKEFKLLSGNKIIPFHKKFDFIDGVTTSIYAGYRPNDENVPSGWNVFCNNRLIIEGDLTNRTGWGGKDGVNFKYPEDLGFLGVVSFHSNNPMLLPWKTTKDDIQLESSLYRKAQREMRLITKRYTDYLTFIAGKKDEDENTLRKIFFSEEHLSSHSIEAKSISEIVNESDGSLPKYLEELIFEPPIDDDPDDGSTDSNDASTEKKIIEKYKHISYSRKKKLVDAVKKHLGNAYMSNKDVGIKTFEYYVDMEELRDGE